MSIGKFFGNMFGLGPAVVNDPTAALAAQAGGQGVMPSDYDTPQAQLPNPQQAPQSGFFSQLGGSVNTALQNPDNRAVLLSIGSQLLSDSGPSLQPISVAQSLGRAMQVGQQTMQTQQVFQQKQQEAQARQAQAALNFKQKQEYYDALAASRVESARIARGQLANAMKPDVPNSYEEYKRTTDTPTNEGYAAFLQQGQGDSGLTNDYKNYKLGLQDPAFAESMAKKGESYDPDTVEPTIDLIGMGDMPMLSGFSLKSPWGQAVLKGVKAKYPQFVGTMNKTLTDFTTGVESRSTRFLNVAIAHLGVAEKVAKALDNHDVRAYNELKNEWRKQFGSELPTNMEIAGPFFANEVAKAITPSGGTGPERVERAETLRTAAAQGQLTGAFNTYAEFLSGQMVGLEQHYKSGTNLPNFRDRFLSPHTRTVLEKWAPPEKGSAGGQQPGWPPIGTVVDGHTYKGGDPNKQESWQ